MKRPSSGSHTALIARLLLAPALLATVASAQSVEELRLTVGKSVVLDYPSDIRQLSTSDPAVADAVAVSTREVLLHAKSPGTATVVVWSRAGQRTIYGINVEPNVEPLRRLLRETFPNETIQVQISRDALALTGNVSTKDLADRAVALATPFGKTIVNNMTIAPPPQEKQIVLRVKFAELNRRASESFGVNIISTGAANTIGSATTGQFTPPQSSGVTGGIPGTLPGARANFSVTDALNIFAFRPDLNLGAFIRALHAQSLLQILAEPNLVTTNDKEASFLVGGEFPVPILQGGGNAGSVTVQFREFGIRLTFKPVITAANTIKMHVKPEVSTIDLNNAVTLSGFTIPALATRRMETDVELNEGQSFVIAGLIDNRVTETMSKIPGLSSIPLLGALFKSTDLARNLSELVVIVTPEIARPLAPGEPHPIPAMPQDFLVPVRPNPQKSSSAAPKGPVKAQSNKQEEHTQLAKKD